MSNEIWGFREWHIQDDWIMRDGFSVWCRMRDPDGYKVVSYVGTVEKVEQGSYISSDKALHLTREDAQQLMNELWRVGLRPRDGAGSIAHVEATKAHLDDMRKLVFSRSPSERCSFVATGVVTGACRLPDGHKGPHELA